MSCFNNSFVTYWFLFAAKGIAKIVSKFPKDPIIEFVVTRIPVIMKIIPCSDGRHLSEKSFGFFGQNSLKFFKRRLSLQVKYNSDSFMICSVLLIISMLLELMKVR